MVAEIVLIPEGMGLDAAKASAQYVARGLTSIGMKVREHISVCPDIKQFQQAVVTALGRSNALVVVGGMGPDSGYMAKTVLSRGLGLPLEESPAAVEGIREYCRRTGERFLPEDGALAMLPRAAAVFSGTHGKLPGCAISSSRQHIIVLPELSAEIPPMFNKYVSPYLGGAENATVTRTMRTYGLREEAVSEKLGDLLNSANPSVTLQRDENEVLVRVLSYAPTQQRAAALCTPMLQSIAERLGDFAYGLDVDSLQSAVTAKLERRQLDLALAEAGTGGNVTRVISETPGGQDILRYSVAIDDMLSKAEKLGIARKILKKEGNVSEYAAVVCAAGAREKAGTSFGLAVLANTGDERARACPVGTVYIAVADGQNVYVKKLVVGDGSADPDVIADAALSRALNMLRLAADYYPEPYTAAIPLDEALEGRRVTGISDYEEDAGGYPDAQKQEKPRSSIRKIIIISASVVLAVALGIIGWRYYSGYIARKQADELANMFMFGEMGDVEVSPDYPRGYSLKFAGLWNTNRDVKAFISIPDTALRYPVVQSQDNNYYLRRDFYDNSNQYGVPYLDYRADVKKPSDNLVVYGHNMRDGQLFGALINYRDLSYYIQHPVIDFSTVHEDGVYKIFSVFITNAYENQGDVWEYHEYADFKNADEENAYLNELSRRSLINTGVDVRRGDKLLTLSTCTYEFKDARLVVVARAVRRGEDAAVDVSAASVNPYPLMPDVWYRTFGGEKPDDAMLMQLSPASLISLSEAEEASLAAQRKKEAEEKAASEASEKAVSEAAEKAASEAAEKAASEAAAKAASEAAEKAASEAAAKAASEAAEREEQERLEREEQERLEQEEQDRIAREEQERLEREEQERIEREASESEDEEWEDIEETNRGGEMVAIRVAAYGLADTEEKLLDVISRVVQNEVGSNFDEEAIKAQAVASYTFIRQANSTGGTPSVAMAGSASSKVREAVWDVLGETVYYRGAVAFTPYHAMSCGSTTSARHVWGGSYPYLTGVDSEVDERAPYYEVDTVMKASRVEELIESRLGITVEGDPEDWFEVLTENDGYNGEMSVCGETRSRRTGSTLTGRLIRESVLNLRSASFEIDYDDDSDSFTFTTYGYGHGVGLSQHGANFLAADGWDYVEILEHYFPGTEVY